MGLFSRQGEARPGGSRRLSRPRSRGSPACILSPLPRCPYSEQRFGLVLEYPDLARSFLFDPMTSVSSLEHRRGIKSGGIAGPRYLGLRAGVYSAGRLQDHLDESPHIEQQGLN